MTKANHRKIKAIASLKGLGLSAYIAECLDKAIDRKTEEVDEDLKEVNALVEAEAVKSD